VRSTLTALAVVALSACATSSPPAAHVTSTSAPRDAPDKIDVDVSALFPATLSRTIGDGRALAPKLLTVVALEKNALTGVDGVEPWLSRLLIEWLLEHGAEVHGDVTATNVTARLRGVRFASLKQDIAISVAETNGAYVIRYWAGKEDISSCAPALKVPLTEVQFEGVLVDANERVVASFAEIAAAEPLNKHLTLVTHGRDACETIASAFSDDLLPNETELDAAARQALGAAFQTLAATH
jgi:hypothetical protein